MLMGVDTDKSYADVIPNIEPHVAFAYMKYLWNTDKKVCNLKSRVICHLLFQLSSVCPTYVTDQERIVVEPM